MFSCDVRPIAALHLLSLQGSMGYNVDHVQAQNRQSAAWHEEQTWRYGGIAFSDALTMVFWCRDAIGRLGSGSTIR